MSVLTRNRFTLLAFAIVLTAQAVFAANPAGRTGVRMVFDTRLNQVILFGGQTGFDKGTAQNYELADTWHYVGDHWVQAFPQHSPPARARHSMVYDSLRQRTLVFGGNAGKIELNDTWSYDGRDWSEVKPADAPPRRQLAGAAFDPVRDRVVLFGGTFLPEGAKAYTQLYDTWEFDGTNWRRRSENGPQVNKPILVYDAGRNETLMIGGDATEKTLMYKYDPAAGTWSELKPATLPACVNEGAATYDGVLGRVILVGGICSTSVDGAGETWSWDGTNWTKADTKIVISRYAGSAIAFDALAQRTLVYGGTLIFNDPRGTLWAFKDANWELLSDNAPTPQARSLAAIRRDPVKNTVWMYGGINDTDVLDEFWKYSAGTWEPVTRENGPSLCNTPNAAYDTDRQKLVVLCADSSTFEWDGTAWKKFSDLKSDKLPPPRRFSSMVYDPMQKKTVMFGGYDEVNYIDQTWVWDGTSWTRIKKNSAPARTNAVMWFDPTLKKIVVYGGLGRRSAEDRLERFSDMWSFDPASGWSEIKNVTTPGARYGAQAAIDPTNNHLVLFGGLRLEVNGVAQTQVYANDMWEWDGAKWTEIKPSAVPPARENAALEFDPVSNRLVLFGGWNGHFMSDLWEYDRAANRWNLRAEAIPQPPPATPPRRRRATP